VWQGIRSEQARRRRARGEIEGRTVANGYFRRIVGLAVAALLSVPVFATGARAAERLCDPAYEDCRTPLLNLINNETVGIDVAFWFMTDTRYETALLNRWHAGVPIRVIVDPKANPTYDGNAQVLADLANAGIPMRYRLATD